MLCQCFLRPKTLLQTSFIPEKCSVHIARYRLPRNKPIEIMIWTKKKLFTSSTLMTGYLPRPSPMSGEDDQYSTWELLQQALILIAAPFLVIFISSGSTAAPQLSFLQIRNNCSSRVSSTITFFLALSGSNSSPSKLES